MSETGPYRVRVDHKRRPSLPQQLLDEAGVAAGQDLIARVEGPGRIVLEDAATVLGRLQAAVRDGMAARGVSGSLAAELLAERAADTSLEPAAPGRPDAPDGEGSEGSDNEDAAGAGTATERRR